MYNTATRKAEKVQWSEQIASQAKEYLASGKKVEVLGSGLSGDNYKGYNNQLSKKGQ